MSKVCFIMLLLAFDYVQYHCFHHWKDGKSCYMEQIRIEMINAASQTSQYQCKVCSRFELYFLTFLQEFPQLLVRSSLQETPKHLPLCSGIPPKRAETSWAIMWIVVWLAPRFGPPAITGPTSTPGNIYIHRFGFLSCFIVHSC